MRVYCASPYTSADPAQIAENVAHAQAVGRAVRALGHVPLVPHIALPEFAGIDAQSAWGQAMAECLSHLKTCDAIVLTGEWGMSPGCLLELEVARSCHIQMFFGLDQLRELA